ncbi:kinase-like protein [Acephala macrosclerotiorum]|nr:kinase-like protein [Acephala macrosclerotiorum]
MPYYPAGDLHSKALERREYVGKDLEIQEAFLQILEAVRHCHSLGIYHRDIKPGNLLLNGSRIVLTDFRWATIDSVSNEDFGTPPYRGPETMTQHPYNCAPNDIWALGVVLVNLTGSWLWDDPTHADEQYFFYTLNKRGVLKKRLSVSDELLDILVQVLEPNPKKRIGTSRLMERISQCSTFFRPVQPSPEPVTNPTPTRVDRDTTSKVAPEVQSEAKCKNRLRSFFS